MYTWKGITSYANFICVSVSSILFPAGDEAIVKNMPLRDAAIIVWARLRTLSEHDPSATKELLESLDARDFTASLEAAGLATSNNHTVLVGDTSSRESARVTTIFSIMNSSSLSLCLYFSFTNPRSRSYIIYMSPLKFYGMLSKFAGGKSRRTRRDCRAAHRRAPRTRAESCGGLGDAGE